MIITYKYRLKRKNNNQLLKHSIVINDIWNYCVNTQKEIHKRYKYGQKSEWISDFDFMGLTSGVSKELRINSLSIGELCKIFVKNRNMRGKCPKYRNSFGRKRSLGWIPLRTNAYQIKENSVVFGKKIYKLYGTESRSIPQETKGGAFFEDSRGRWWVALHVDVKEDNNHGNKEIGLDLGLKDLVTTSDGEKHGNPIFYRKSEQKLKAAQRANNKFRIKAINTKTKNQRQDYLHKLSNKLVRESSLIVVGNVKSSKLAKTRMAKSVYDAGWYAFREMLRYKASRHGVKYLETNEAFTTQTCSHCGQRPPSRPKGIAGLGIREWVCSLCGTSHDRDVNAAKNILTLGRGAAPPDEESRIFVSVEGAQKDGVTVLTKGVL